MDALSKALRADPLSYLPETSLALLWYFRKGHDLRYAMEGRSYQWRDDSSGSFAGWVRKRFGLNNGRALSHLALISSFSASETEAFFRYFELLEEFALLSPPLP